MMKKTLAAILSVCVAAAGLTGCTSGSSTATTAASSGAAAAENQVASAGSGDEAKDAGHRQQKGGMERISAMRTPGLSACIPAHPAGICTIWRLPLHPSGSRN